MIKNNETKVISFDEILAYYKQGWTIVKSVLASSPEEAINAYEHSFTEPDDIEINYSRYDLSEIDAETSLANVNSISINDNRDSKVITTSVLGVGSSIAATEFSLFDSEDITSKITTLDYGVNPASGLPMMGGVDVGGNAYGTSSIDISIDITADSMFISDSSFDTFSSGGVDTFDNLF